MIFMNFFIMIYFGHQKSFKIKAYGVLCADQVSISCREQVMFLVETASLILNDETGIFASERGKQARHNTVVCPQPVL